MLKSKPPGERDLAERQNLIGDLDSPEFSSCRTETQARLAVHLSRRFALRLGLAAVVADHLLPGGRA